MNHEAEGRAKMNAMRSFHTPLVEPSLPPRRLTHSDIFPQHLSVSLCYITEHLLRLSIHAGFALCSGEQIGTHVTRGSETKGVVEKPWLKSWL